MKCESQQILSWLNNAAPTYCVHAKNWKYQAVAFTYPTFNGTCRETLNRTCMVWPKNSYPIWISLQLVYLSRLRQNKINSYTSPSSHHGERHVKQQYCIHHDPTNTVTLTFISYQWNVVHATSYHRTQLVNMNIYSNRISQSLVLPSHLFAQAAMCQAEKINRNRIELIDKVSVWYHRTSTNGRYMLIMNQWLYLKRKFTCICGKRNKRNGQSLFV